MFIVGLTGGIATGKSTVASMFIELNVPVIDADKIARKVVEPGKKAWFGIRDAFGAEILESDGQINRDILARIIFSDPQKRLLLNRITHPEVYKEICWEIVKCFFKGYQFVIIDSPLLFEARVWLKYVHKTIVVTCEEDLQLERLMDRNKLLESEAKARVSSQMSLREKCEKASFIIENSGNLDDTKNQVVQIYGELSRSWTHWKIRFVASLFGGGLVSFIYWMYQTWYKRS